MNSSNLKRYSKIRGHFPREAILIQGQGCVWKKCIFCDYYLDISENPYSVNLPVIESITGEFGSLDVSNSGSAMEIDKETLHVLMDQVAKKNIKNIWFEARWNYRHAISEFKKLFPQSVVKFRMGVESFNPVLRAKWRKGVPSDVTPAHIAKFYDGVSLLIGLNGQTIEDVYNDIQIADSLFEYFSINVFTENTTDQKPNFDLIREFTKKILPYVRDNPKADVLLKNTDWGIG